MRHRQGSLLVLSLWAVGFLSIVTMAVASRGAIALQLHSRVMEQLQSSTAAYSAYVKALVLLEEDETGLFDGLNEAWMEKQRSKAGPVSESTGMDQSIALEWSLWDENAKLSLNSVPAEILQNLIVYLGLADQSTAIAISESVVDWRDADNESHRNGAEDYYYMGLRPSYECKDAPFENLEELLLVKEMMPQIYAGLRDYLTVYSDGSLNINTAGEAIIYALGLSVSGTEGLLTYRSGEDRTWGNQDDRMFVSPQAIAVELDGYLPQYDLNKLSEWVDLGIVGVRANSVRLECFAENIHDYGRVGIQAVFDRSGWIALWTEL